MVLLLFAFFLIFATIINGRPFGVLALTDITGGVGLLDMQVLFSPEQAYAHFNAMGEAGRAFNLSHIVPLDLVFPFVYALFFSVTITWILSHWLPIESRWQRLNVIPLLAGLGDYLENAGIITMLLSWPYQSSLATWFTMIAGCIKFLFLSLSIIILAGSLIGWIIFMIPKASPSRRNAR